jgi:polyisoprenoid-binding protein YceI
MPSISDGVWRLDPDRSSVEFHARSAYGLLTVKGRFGGYHGTLDLSARPAIALTVEAGSLDTKNARRDKHLRSPDFFDVDHHPQIRFEADNARLAGEDLKIYGRLHALGRQMPLDVDATVREVDGQLEIEASALADQRELGMTWNFLGLVGAPTRLILRGRLTPAH